MNERSIVVVGLPASGKTTFLAALWHLVTSRDVETKLRFGSLGEGDREHLNSIAARWRDAKEQDRTARGGNRLVRMSLIDEHERHLRITFPDTAGEAYRQMWEERECDVTVAETLKSVNVMLFIHADTITQPMWVVDEADLARRMGIPLPDNQVVSWDARLAPTQVQLVELLQFLHCDALDVGPRRLAIILSAWDKAEPEELAPSAFLESKLPLLGQYLRRNPDRWASQIYGLSAQGGDYDAAEGDVAPKPQAEELRKLDQASTRIRLVTASQYATHDLTAPLSWLVA